MYPVYAGKKQNMQSLIRNMQYGLKVLRIFFILRKTNPSVGRAQGLLFGIEFKQEK